MKRSCLKNEFEYCLNPSAESNGIQCASSNCIGFTIMENRTPYLPLPKNDETLIPSSMLPAYIGVPSQTLARWRHEGAGPAYVKLGRSVAYKSSSVRSWIDEQSHLHTAWCQYQLVDAHPAILRWSWIASTSSITTNNNTIEKFRGLRYLRRSTGEICNVYNHHRS